jgi:hypothetical protein
MSLITTMPGQVNPDLGVKVYPTEDNTKNYEIVSSVQHEGYIYNLLKSDEMGVFYVQKITMSGDIDTTWGGKQDFTKSFIVYDVNPQGSTNIYAFSGIKLDIIYPQDITIFNDKVWIVGNVKYNTDNAIQIEGAGTGDFPSGAKDISTDYKDRQRGFLSVLKLDSGLIDEEYYTTAYGGDYASNIAPNITSSDPGARQYFVSSSTIWTNVNVANNSNFPVATGFTMPPYEKTDSLYIYVYGYLGENLHTNEYAKNVDSAPINGDLQHSGIIGEDENNQVLIVGNHSVYDAGSPGAKSITVKAYSGNKLEFNASFANIAPEIYPGVLVIDPDGTNAIPQSGTRLAIGNTITKNGSNIVIGGNVIAETLNTTLGVLSTFDPSGVIDLTFASGDNKDDRCAYVSLPSAKVTISNIFSPNTLADDLLVSLSIEDNSSILSSQITKIINSSGVGVVDTGFGSAGFFTPTLPGYNIVVSKTDLELNNTRDISIFNNDYYISLTALEGGDQNKATGLVVKINTDGDTVADFGTNGYAQFNANTVPGDKTTQIITQTIQMAGYVSQTGTVIGWAFGAGSASPFVPLGIPFNLYTYSSICFPAGTPINTDQGIKNIENIRTKIHTINGNKINAITKTIMKKLNYLVVLEQGCIYNNVPSKQTICSPNHKILYRGEMIEANLLLEKKVGGVYTKKYDNSLLYNVLLDSHSTMTVNNMTTETLHPRNPIGLLYNKHIPQTLKKQAIIHCNLKEKETKHICKESFLLQKYVYNPEPKYKTKFGFSLKK